MHGIVIVGAGIAGAFTAMRLRENGYDGRLTVIGEEPCAPYQRPPLSKEMLAEAPAPVAVELRSEDFWREREVDILTGVAAMRIDSSARRVVLADGERLRYGHLVLATGSRNRRLPVMTAPRGVVGLRTLADAERLAESLVLGARLVVVGGGFIGLEVAAAARSRAVEVTVVELLDRILCRLVSPEVSAFFRAEHESNGVRVLTSHRVEQVLGGERVTGVRLEGGRELPADLVVVGIGVTPNVELAAAAGLETRDGILVDDHLLTSDPAISAIGDCARFPCAASRRSHRLESVQNATDQAYNVAGRLTGSPEPYLALPWFWSVQYGRKLQIAGVAGAAADSVLRGDPASGRFSVCRFQDGRLVAVESVGRPADHLAARRLLGSAAATRITPAEAADESRPLKAHP